MKSEEAPTRCAAAAHFCSSDLKFHARRRPHSHRNRPMPPSARAKALAADGLRSSQSTHEIRPRRQAHGAGTARTAWSPSYAASRSPGLYSSGSEAELRIASHRLRLAALQERHGADNSATLLLVERSRPRLPTPRRRVQPRRRLIQPRRSRPLPLERLGRQAGGLRRHQAL